MVEDWYECLGKPPPQWENLQVKEFQDVVYHSDFTKGYSLAVQGGVVSYVTLQSGRNPRFPRYAGSLPYGLTWEETNTSIVRRLGEPTKATRPPSRGLGIELTYDCFGLTVELMTNEWEETANLIRTLILFTPKVTGLRPFQYPPGSNFCAVCRQPSGLKCGRCRVINYCSAECQRLHWSAQHKKDCFLSSVK